MKLKSHCMSLVLAGLFICFLITTANAATEASLPSRSLLTDIDLNVPRYERKRPKWAIELATSPNALGQKAWSQAQGSVPVFAFHLAGEYQPPTLQKYGVFSIGPSFGVYPALEARVTPSYFSIWSFGAQARYQARYFREQPVVPMIAYAFDSVSYQFSGGSRNNLVLQGPVAGLWILLNFLDRSSADTFHIEKGILRTYAVVEARYLTGDQPDAGIHVDRSSYYFGLRFEF